MTDRFDNTLGSAPPKSYTLLKLCQIWICFKKWSLLAYFFKIKGTINTTPDINKVEHVIRLKSCKQTPNMKDMTKIPHKTCNKANMKCSLKKLSFTAAEKSYTQTTEKRNNLGKLKLFEKIL